MEEHLSVGATGVGSWPGTEITSAVRETIGELADSSLPYLPELPARGPWAQMIGRGVGILVDLPAELEFDRWKMTGRPGRDLRRCRSLLDQDLEVLSEVAEGYRGAVKVQVVGPWTLAGQLWVPSAERAVADPGAYRDLIASLSEGVAEHLRTVRRLLPGATVVLQIDEPSLTAVIDGTLLSASGMRRLPAADPAVVTEGLRQVVTSGREAGAGVVVLHSCAGQFPVPVLSGAGLDAVNLDLTVMTTVRWEELATVVEAGITVWPGLVPVTEALPSVASLVDTVWRPWRELGLAREHLASAVVTPVCGLAGLDLRSARSVLTRTREVSSELNERLLG